MKLLAVSALLTIVYLTKGTYSTDIRLVGGDGKKTLGRVELFHDGKWGSTCTTMADGDDIFADVRVFCRMLDMLGFVYDFEMQFSGSTWLNTHNVKCTGTEADIDACDIGNWSYDLCTGDGALKIACLESPDINECKSNPCQNGGTCHDAVKSYSCDCQPGFTGKNCETDIDECASRPCLNGATCNDHVNGYTCQCGALFTGVNCETATACLIANGQQRKSCGKFSQTEQECIDNGCCWDGSHAEKICFKKLIKKCSIAEAVRTQCPGLFATEGECTANGCCWDNQFKLGSAGCYLPGYE